VELTEVTWKLLFKDGKTGRKVCLFSDVMVDCAMEHRLRGLTNEAVRVMQESMPRFALLCRFPYVTIRHSGQFAVLPLVCAL
jgi:hypothetical protein